MSPYLKLLRPHQWVKNGFVLAPLIFAGKLLHVPSLILGFSAFAIFCIASSGVYAFNDIFDREQDRNHPKKRDRPVASGKIGVLTAALVGAGLFVISLLGAATIGKGFLLWVSFYLLLQFGYNVAFRNIVILDILTIAMGFVIRAVAGSIAIGVIISPWLILCSLLIALFLNEDIQESVTNREHCQQSTADQEGDESRHARRCTKRETRRNRRLRRLDGARNE